MPDPMHSHRVRARIENAHFLMEDCHMTLTEAAQRLGVKVDCLEKELERERART